MRKRIAVFANGWGMEYLQEIGNGILRCAKLRDADIFAFVNYSVHAGSKEDDAGEFNILKLPDFRDFDGALVLANSFNRQLEVDYLYQKLLETKVPAISLEYKLAGIDYIGTDNYSGMYEMAEHLIKVHGVKRILFVGGYEEHKESQIRLKAVLDAAKDNSLEVPEDSIIYGYWGENYTKRCIGEWIKKHDYLPDAVICANDNMAVGACDWMREQGYRVPEDIKITGYDGLRLTREHHPVIATVSRNWDNMGYNAMERLFDKMAGKETNPVVELKTSLACGESCGCRPEKEQNAAPFPAKKAVNDKMAESLSMDQHFRHMYLAVRKDETAEQLNKSLSDFIRDEGWMEGQKFMLCLHPQFFAFAEQDDIFKTDGYSDTMNVICSFSRGVAEKHQKMDTKRAMFHVAEESESPGCYIFVPVRSDDKAFGFAMLTRNFEIVNNNFLYIWTRHMNQYLEQVRSNVKIAELTKRLKELSVTDILTGVYNRTGCEKVIYPYLGQCQRRGGRAVVIMADIDRMKAINDQFGHGQGDLALCIVSSILRRALPQGFLVGRYGGDEFFIGGESDGVTPVEEMIHQVMLELEKETEIRKLPFPLTLSMGGVELEEGEAFELSSSLQRADASMYEEKRRHHEGD
ncbi:MAG: GGDEF domain-containing protein [Roseburia sp.]|nr:GGDEF domain-containing protein [Roseburia sp.]